MLRHEHKAVLGTIVTAVSCVLSDGAVANPPTAWIETINEDGIRVFKRVRAGSPYEEVRAEARLSGKVGDFLPFFNDPAHYKKWVYGTIESRMLNRTKDFDFVFQGVFDIPWPFENRELISRVELIQGAVGELTAKLSHHEDKTSVGQGLVRVERFESLWKVVQVEEKKVDLSIEMYVEPGGKLPPFIVNLVLSRIQLWSINNLRKQITAP